MTYILFSPIDQGQEQNLRQDENMLQYLQIIFMSSHTQKRNLYPF